MDNLQIKKRIMRRVYTVYALRKVLSNTALKIYASIALLYGIKVFVHVAAVAENMPDFSNVAGLYNFMLYSVMNTELAVQFIVFGSAVLAIWVMRDTIKNIFARSMQNSMQSAH